MTRARSGSSCKVFVVTRMVGPPLESARLELHAARGPPDAELLAAEQRARDLGHDREHVETGEGVDSRIAEGGRLPGDDLLELHEVEEERIVAYPGEHRHPTACGHDRHRAVADANRGRLRPGDDSVRRSRGGGRRRAAEVHDLVPARTG